jgi:hypothetical protein
MKNSHSKQFFNVHVKKIKIEIHPKMIMIWAYEIMAHFRPFKSPQFFLVNFFLVIFLHICFKNIYIIYLVPIIYQK